MPGNPADHREPAGENRDCHSAGCPVFSHRKVPTAPRPVKPEHGERPEYREISIPSPELQVYVVKLPLFDDLPSVIEVHHVRARCKVFLEAAVEAVVLVLGDVRVHGRAVNGQRGQTDVVGCGAGDGDGGVEGDQLVLGRCGTRYTPVTRQAHPSRAAPVRRQNIPPIYLPVIASMSTTIRSCRSWSRLSRSRKPTQ